jgi:hypothetical protein
MARSRLPPNYALQLPPPLAPLLIDRSNYHLLNDAKEVTVAGEAGLEFGNIAGPGAASTGVSFEYVTTDGEEFVMGAALVYSGDAGAFTISATEWSGGYVTPVALTDGFVFFLPIPPDTSGPWNITVTALYANVGVAKAGTLAIVDRFDFANAGAPLRTLKTLTLSKTAV